MNQILEGNTTTSAEDSVMINGDLLSLNEETTSAHFKQFKGVINSMEDTDCNRIPKGFEDLTVFSECKPGLLTSLTQVLKIGRTMMLTAFQLWSQI